ncbi:MAG: c-type cytochrome [Oligoflexia bacterium]|nr:c-type cytochrome [Oligoflexia bacterium]
METQKPAQESHGHHHILSTEVALGVGFALLLLTGLTVWIAGVDLGRLNFLVALLVASVKAALVALFFMNLLYDRRENGVIFGTSFLFLAIFLVLTATDLFFRGDVAVKGPLTAFAQSKTAQPKVARPWVATPLLLSQGKMLYSQQCVACHGPEGKGDGPAAGSLTPAPRDFTRAGGWKNGRKPSQVFKTLVEGIPGSAMAPYGTLPAEDRWALAHFVLSLGEAPEADTDEDLLKVGIDVKGGGQVVQEAPSIPLEVAMRRLTRPEPRAAKVGAKIEAESAGGRLYLARCASCHGEAGEGAIARVSGTLDAVRLRTAPLSASQAVGSPAIFESIVSNGLPGLMPGLASLNGTQLSELREHVRKLVAAQQ